MIEIVRSKAERAKQPWHVRVRSSGNTKVLVTGETLTDLDAVATELTALGREFSPVGVAEYHGNESGGVLSIWLEDGDDEDDWPEKLGIPVGLVDLRLEVEQEPDAPAEEKPPAKKRTSKKAAAADG